MKYTMILAVSLMLVSVITAGAIDVIHLSTLDKTETVSLPRISPYTPAISNASPGVVQLSTLGRKIQRSTIEPKELSAAKPVTITPSFAIMNANITAGTNTVITMPHALAGAQINYLRPNVTVWTPPIAIFGGA
ncbi:hypothetical protein [Methanothrix sp.]|uniref:hypothetical protein n=1 Tax=Methanothrix sp. TaxID=90426 RepID=UPI003C789532